MTKICSNCKEEKDLNDFFNNKKGVFGKASQCKICTTFKYKNRRNKDDYNEWARQYRTKENNKKYEKDFRKKYLSSLTGHASKLCRGAKSRANKKGIDFDIDTNFIINKLQPMVCEVTGLPLTLKKYEDNNFRVSPFNPSIDRRDCTKGYTKDNIQIVCWMYNLAKGDFTDELVLQMAKALVSKNT